MSGLSRERRPLTWWVGCARTVNWGGYERGEIFQC